MKKTKSHKKGTMLQEFSGIDRAQSTLDSKMTEAQENLLRAKDLMQKVNSLEGSAESEDGRVFITVNNAGGLVDIGLAEDAVELKTQDLTALIMSTFREARRKVTDSYADLVYDELGEDSAVAKEGVRQMRTRLADEGSTDDDRFHKAISNLWRQR
mgnify:FL=1